MPVGNPVMSSLRDRLISIIFGAAGTGVCVYVGWSIWHGCIRLSSRSTDVMICHAASPSLFWLSVTLYVMGAAIFFWIARGVLKQ